MKSKLIRAGIFTAIIGALLLAHYIWLGSKPVVNNAARKAAGRNAALLANGATAYQAANIAGDKPVVVLVPDMVLNSAVWENTYSELSKNGMAVLRYDLFGSGFSARPKGAYDTEFFAAQLEALVNKVLPGRDLILIGLGDGAAVASAYAATHAGRVKKIVLIDAVGIDYNMPFRARMIKMPAVGRYFGRMLGGGLAKGLIADSFSTTPSPAVMSALESQIATRGYADALRSSFRHGKRQNSRQAFLSLAPQKIPTLIMWGLRDKITPFASMAELHKILTHAETAVFENSGHAPVIDEPDVVHRRLVQFLKSEKKKD